MVKMMAQSTLYEDLTNDKDTFKTFVKLSCLYSPREVKQYLKLNESKHYEISEVLKFVRDANILDAVGYLLERMGDTKGALECYLKDFRESYDALWPFFRTNHKHIPDLTEEGLMHMDKLDEQEGVFYHATELTDV